MCKLSMTGIHDLHFYLLNMELGVSEYLIHLLSAVEKCFLANKLTLLNLSC